MKIGFVKFYWNFYLLPIGKHLFEIILFTLKFIKLLLAKLDKYDFSFTGER
jgi:hypothetical protein